MTPPRASMISSRRKSVSANAAILASVTLFLFSIWIVDSMVVSPAPRKSSRSSIFGGKNNGDTKDSDALLRMLLEGQGNGHAATRGKSPSSYSIEASVQGQTSIENPGPKQRTSPLLDEWRDFEALRETTLEDEALRPFFFDSGWERQQIIANRFVKVLKTLYSARDDWEKSQEERAAANAKLLDGNDEVSLKAPDIDDPAAIRLCEAVASLGPLAVKLGQTLSQRPDIVGKEACFALKRLQTQNTPFDDDLAYAVMRESLDYWDGPLAANLPEEGESRNVKPLFCSLSKEPIASASLGQVYKATTWEGVDIALKVQRPDALATIATDTQCFRIASNFRNTVIDWTEQWNAIVGENSANSAQEHTMETGMTEDEVRSKGEEGTVSSVIDRVAKDILREMDYTVEAANSYKFRDSLAFLGFVDTPDVLLATDKILATSFVNGHHLGALKNPKDELALTRMAVEACTASMVLTGFVHADPHEGNLMFREDDGRIVFLDFGLMSDVEQGVMEAFARGIGSLLSEDFVSVTEAFSDTGFITRPIMYRQTVDDLWRIDPDHGLDELAIDLESAMRTTEGGMSRFGALATVLNKKISPNWLVFTPPYVLLLIRTFLTLEGIAAQVDPDFNIYAMSLPWVVRRSLSPSTEKGTKVLRKTILKADNKIQWERIMDLMEMQKAAAAASSEAAPVQASTTAVEPSSVTIEPASETKETFPTIAAAMTPEEKEQKEKEYAAARQLAMKDAVGTLLGSTNGKALRGILKDLDTPDLIWKLGSKQGRPIVRMGTEKVLNSLFSSSKSKSKAVAETESRPMDEENYRPVSDECKRLRSRQEKRTKQITKFLVKRHMRRSLFGIKGIAGITRLAFSTVQIAASIILRKTMGRLFASSQQRLPNALPAVAAAPAE